MSVGKLLSILVFVIAAAVLLVILLGSRLGLWATLPDDLLFAAIVGVIGSGLITALFYSLGGGLHDAELARLRRHIESFSRAELATVHYRPTFWLRPLTDAINRTLQSLRQRIELLQTQRRELEIQARIADAERQHAEAILHSISDAVIVTDAFNELAIANDAAARLLNFPLDQAKHRPIDRIVGDSRLVKLIKDTRESGNPLNRRHVEHRIESPTRSDCYDVTLHCVTNQQDEVAGVVTILHDVTREKQISEMKSDFVSSVSHELRTPLSSIKAYVEMLVDGEANDEQTRTEFYNIIQSETNRLSRLIDNILNISRIESGIVKINREHVSLPAVIKDVVDVMQPQAHARQIKLTVRETPLFYQIYADRDMIYQAALNLVGNAIKYTPPGGSVTLDTMVDDHQRMVTVNVTDTGVGIPPEALPHLFQKFYRVADHKKMAKGTGLGLNLVKHIVETVHGGHVSVTSEVGKGSTFSFALPISDGAL